MVICTHIISCVFFSKTDSPWKAKSWLAQHSYTVTICMHQARRKRSTMNFMERMEVDAEHKQAYAQAGNKSPVNLWM